MSNTNKTQQLGLIGYPLTHSFSPSYFAQKFTDLGIDNWSYEAFSMENIDLLPQLLSDKANLVGFNVTIPYKQQVMAYLDELDETAKEIGAVNTVKRVGERLIGYNTDAYGFEYSVKELLGDKQVKQALILGTGGASKAVVYVLNKLGIAYKMVSRSEGKADLTYDTLTTDILATHQLIINTTPLGTYPNVDTAPKLDYSALTATHYLLDLVYNPAVTSFLAQGKAQGTKTLNGLLMLHQQAERAWDIWTTKV